MNKYYVTQPVYMVASNRMVQPVFVKDNIGDMYLVKFESSGSIWLHESRLFPSRNEASNYLKQFRQARQGKRSYREILH